MRISFISGLFIVVLASCSFCQNGKTLPLRLTNALVRPLLCYNQTTLSFQLKPEYDHLRIPFSNSEKKIVPKGDNYGCNMISTDGRYYPVATYKYKGGQAYKLIVYHITGDSDTDILVTQLNSYKQDSLIDALILEMNFTFETQISSRYSVNDSVAVIDRYEVNDILYDEESGDILGTKSKPDTVVHRSVYKIINGRFVKKQDKRIM